MGFLAKLFGKGKTKTSQDPKMRAILNARDVLDHTVVGTLLTVAFNEQDNEMMQIVDTKKIHCLFCNATVETKNVVNNGKDVEAYCPLCGKLWFRMKGQ